MAEYTFFFNLMTRAQIARWACRGPGRPLSRYS